MYRLAKRWHEWFRTGVDEASPGAAQRRLVSPRLADATDLEQGKDGELRQLLTNKYLQIVYPRKLWEYEYIAQAAHELGALDSAASALGIAVGTESLIFYFARHIRSVTATDLYSPDSPWTEVQLDDATKVLDLAPFPFPRDRVRIENADMRKLPYDDEQFDFCWSCSSIEHVQTYDEMLAIYSEIARVLKIGGHAILTTEFCLTPPYTLPGVLALDRGLFRTVVEAVPSLELIGAPNFEYRLLHPGNAPEPRRYGWFGLVNPFCDPYLFHSGRMAVMAGLSILVPVAFVLRKTSTHRPQPYSLQLPEPLSAFNNGVKALQRRYVTEARNLFVQLLGQSTTQFQMIARRYHLEAALLAGADVPQALRIQDAFLAAIPEGALQDADCLDLLGYSLGEVGRHSEAAMVYKWAAASPSTSTEHVAQLAVKHLIQSSRAGSVDDAITFLALTVRDMIERGVPWTRLEPIVMQHLSEESGLLPAVQAALLCARRESMSRWAHLHGFDKEFTT
jgi:ubiquinone/menaquinone biosynthesis C-methylase UbiE